MPWDVKDLGHPAKEFGLYPEGIGEVPKNFRQGDGMSRFALLEVHSGGHVENRCGGSTDKAERAGKKQLYKSQHEMMRSGRQSWQWR